MVSVSANDVLYGLLLVRGGKYIQLIYNGWSLIQYRGRSPHSSKVVRAQAPDHEQRASTPMGNIHQHDVRHDVKGAVVTAEKWTRDRDNEGEKERTIFGFKENK